MKYLLIFTLAISSNLFGAGLEKIEEIEQFEIRSYAPQKVGVTDLVFEARIDNLTEMLTKNLAVGKLVDVSYKIYWASPSQYKIEVQGLPKGFAEVKQDLISLIRGKMEFVLPEKFMEKFKGYSLKAESVSEGKLIRAIDPTYTMVTSEVDILMDKNGILKTIETKTTGPAVRSEFSYSPKSWSNNKLVLDKIVLRTMQTGVKLSTINDVEYLSVNGIGLPSKITVRNISEATVPATKKEKEKKLKKEIGSVIRFSKYEVNTGKALRFINEGQRK